VWLPAHYPGGADVEIRIEKRRTRGNEENGEDNDVFSVSPPVAPVLRF
jgi:hypothetical protein